MAKENYPQFISNLPYGKDYTEGRSQERLAVAIAEHITSTDGKMKLNYLVSLDLKENGELEKVM